MNTNLRDILVGLGLFALVAGIIWGAGNYYLVDPAKAENEKLAAKLKKKNDENASWEFVRQNYPQFLDEGRKAREAYFAIHPRVEGDLAEFLASANKAAKERQLALDLIPSREPLKPGLNALGIRVQAINQEKGSNQFAKGYGRILSFSEWLASSRQLVTTQTFSLVGNDSVGATRLELTSTLVVDVPDEKMKNNILFSGIEKR